jgi:hypothetical protein
MDRLLSSDRAQPVGEPLLAAWTLPLIVAAIAVVIVGGFYLGGPGLGMAAGALAATSIVVMAVRHPPRGPIVPASLRDFRHHLLVVVSGALEDERAIEQIVEVAGIGDVDQAEAEVVVLVAARHRFLDRWASDSDPAHDQAQRYLVLSAASLAKAGVATAARVGDEDMVQAVEDELRTFPATEVVLVTGAPDCDVAGNAAASELDSRLQADFHHLILDSPRPPVGGPESTIR